GIFSPLARLAWSSPTERTTDGLLSRRVGVGNRRQVRFGGDRQIERFEAAHSDGVGIIGEQMSQPKVISQTSKERIVRPCSRGLGAGHVPPLLAGAEHPAERLKPAWCELITRHGSIQCTLTGSVVSPATARAVLRNCPEVIEGGDDSSSADVAEAERAHAGRINNPALSRRGDDPPAPPREV